MSEKEIVKALFGGESNKGDWLRVYTVGVRLSHTKQEYKLSTELKASTDIETIKKTLLTRFEILLHEVFK